MLRRLAMLARWPAAASGLGSERRTGVAGPRRRGHVALFGERDVRGDDASDVGAA